MISTIGTDWTPILTAAVTGIAGVAGGLIGYLAARHQGSVELEKIEVERDRLKHEREEPHLQHRQGIYHRFLDSAVRWHQERAGVDPFKDPDEYNAWAREHEHNLSAVSLFGTVAAYEKALELSKIIEDTMGHAGEPDSPEGQYPHEAEFLAKWREVVEAMRLDTAPKQHAPASGS
jgi:hypothetical protein